MDAWKEYAFTLIVIALCCGILIQTVSDTKGKALVRLISGVVLAIVLLQPLEKRAFEEILQLPEFDESIAEFYIEEGRKTAIETKRAFIEAQSEAYILNKAKMLGGEITVQVFLDEDLVPDFAQIHEKGETSIQKHLEIILSTDLGIPKEHQKWIWKQDGSGS